MGGAGVLGMTPFDWASYAVGGATRPDSFSGMTDDFGAALARMFAEAPPEIQAQLRVGSGYRSPERQGQLWREAVAKYGSEEEARRWVAPPGRSQHNHGNAADLKFLSPDARAWVHANADRYGLSFPLSNEDWHVELASARGGAPHTAEPPAPGVQTAQNALAAQPVAAQNALALPDNRMDPRAFMRAPNALAFAPLAYERRNVLGSLT